MRRLKTRLDRLTAAAGDDITRADRLLLVSILARRDALFWPWRWTPATQPPMAEIRRRQRAYLEGVEGVSVKADGRQQWKDSSAARQRLLGAGLVTANHSSGQVQSVFVTPKGEALARSLVGGRLHTMATSGRILHLYLRLKSQQTPVRAVRESVLFNQDCVGNPERWNDQTEMILPLLVSGLVKADSDTQGRVAYTPTDNATAPEAVEIEPPTETDPDFEDGYFAAFNGERHVLQNCEPLEPTEVYVPLPATGWGWPCHFPQETTHEAE